MPSILVFKCVLRRNKAFEKKKKKNLLTKISSRLPADLAAYLPGGSQTLVKKKKFFALKFVLKH